MIAFYTEVISDVRKATLQTIIRGKADIRSVIHTDSWRGYHGLVDVGFDKHFQVNRAQNELARGRQHINGIESFWSFVKARLAQFKGVSGHTFELRLKECEFRFNHRHKNLYQTLLTLFPPFLALLIPKPLAKRNRCLSRSDRRRSIKCE